MEKGRRRELTEDYKAQDAKKSGGVAAISNTVTDSRLLAARGTRGAESRFVFSQATNFCSQIETTAEFAEEIDALLDVQKQVDKKEAAPVGATSFFITPCKVPLHRPFGQLPALRAPQP
ncbi:hypothetical protein SDC9_110981 [bioreactor metagenome]|uniref:Uncharacterized protein n=1 Tax=bioreactor metagenome TaxID=1076179 RepID=A0A645BF62_9ZZZZ